MDNTATAVGRIYREQRFRTPLSAERAIGLWVDRIGIWQNGPAASRFRQLGQYAALAVTDGRGQFQTDADPTIELNPGDAFILFPETPARYGGLPELHHRGLVFNGPDADTFTQLGYLDPARPLLRGQGAIVVRAHAELAAIMADEDLAAVLHRRNIVANMVLQLFSAGRQAQSPHPADAAIRRAIAFIEAHCTETTAIDALARRFGLSPTHFRRLFKRHTGRTPQQFLTACRISRAKALLTGGWTVAATAGRLGYEDPFYFMRVFKQTVGVPPGEFARRSH